MGLLVEVGKDARRLCCRLVLKLCLARLSADDLAQAFVARQAQDIIDTVLFAPAHQLLATEAGVGAEHDVDHRPAGAQLPDDALHFRDRTSRRVLIGRPEPCAQQLIAGEDIKRQIAIVIVVAVEETLRLVTVESAVRWPQVSS